MAEQKAFPGAVPILSLAVRNEEDVVYARQRARQIAQLLGLDVQHQTRVATAVSELARNVYEYAGGGKVYYSVENVERDQLRFVIKVEDKGPGIVDLDAVLDGKFVSPKGMGLGILGARRLSDFFSIESQPGAGTVVEIAQRLPPERAFAGADAARLSAKLSEQSVQSPFQEVQRQNHDLIQTLGELHLHQTEVEQLNAELERTNRGVLALYAELDDHAKDLVRASEYKSRFLSDISHELRTPLTSVLNLTRLLLDRTDGELTEEQDLQISMIKRSTEVVIELVNELLDIATIEAGKTVLNMSAFTVAELFESLNAMVKPLKTSASVALIFEDGHEEIMLRTDEKRLAQVFRNLLSNALKFTETGEVRTVAALVASAGGERVRFSVIDTGIGIAPEYQLRIFEDFMQVDGPVQRRVRGSGLGLSLTRKLTELLGGTVGVQSAPGVGSTFTVEIPRIHPDAMAEARVDSNAPPLSVASNRQSGW